MKEKGELYVNEKFEELDEEVSINISAGDSLLTVLNRFTEIIIDLFKG
jgi:hypothetical protein